MVNDKMIIPDTINVGYQKRDDTYTGKLAYIVYTDAKGKLRKETSWQNWRDKKLGQDDLKNEPISGFVLNKKAGGVGSGWGWNDRVEKVRVYDPRDFEFEISIPNLLFILQECSAIKGKGLEGEFVYAWNGTELILLPVNCSTYKECQSHTERQLKKVDKTDIKEGFTYRMKDGTDVMYLGRHHYNDIPSYYSTKKDLSSYFKPVGMKHIFMRIDINQNKKNWYNNQPYIAESGFTKIAEKTSDSVIANFADEHDKFRKSYFCAEIKDIKLIKISFSDSYLNKSLLIKEGDDYYLAKVENRYRSNSYALYKSSKALKLELDNKTKTIKLPSLSAYTNESPFELAKKDFYSISVISEKGTCIQL